MKLTKTIDPRLPPEIIIKFCQDNDLWVIALDDNLSSDFITSLYHAHMDSGSPLILSEIAQHDNTQIGILEQFSYSDDESILISLATNPRLSPDMIDRLRKTDSYTVWEHLSRNKCVPEKYKKEFKKKMEIFSF